VWQCQDVLTLIQSTLLGGISAQLLTFVKDPQNLPHAMDAHVNNCLLFFAYGGVIFNSAATINTLMLTYMVTNLTITAAGRCTSGIIPD
jgi:hypothetical protein